MLVKRGVKGISTLSRTFVTYTPPKVSVKFSLPDSPGSLNDALKYFWKHSVNMTHLESRPSLRSTDYEFVVDFEGNSGDKKVQGLLKDLKSISRDVTLLPSIKVPWFPRKLKDLDLIANQTLDAGDHLQSDHPGFQDEEYRTRRSQFEKLAREYKQGTPIPITDYTENEIATWKAIYDRVYPVWEKHACYEHLNLIPALEEHCGYRRSIPQLRDICDFLQSCTGFTLRPVPGLLSSRNFLYGLAFRVFFTTQYIRHHSRPLYTPEPDICHELLGHAPLFADPGFADFSQEIGLAAIGATDEQIKQLARCYWYSVEFGLCQQNGERKAYGAGLLSSFGELEWSMSEKPEVRPWDPFKASEVDFPITTYQPLYWIAESFEDAKNRMKDYALSLRRPYNVRFNPWTHSIEVDRNIELATDKPPVEKTLRELQLEKEKEDEKKAKIEEAVKAGMA